MNAKACSYVGRFAPSPTGPLHFGSLLAALASYAEARRRDGIWLLRIEDIDPPRERPGADKLIIETLEKLGFEWDGTVSYQSRSTERHEYLVQQLLAADLAYRCSCSRKDLAKMPRGPLGLVYPGTCRQGCGPGATAVRVRTNDQPIEFIDGLQGRYCQRLESETGDFVIKRRDGLIAYHLAVVADDHDQQVTDVVRGVDLLDSTPRQMWLQRVLNSPTPAYMHIPVAVDVAGHKLSKATGAAPVPADHPGRTLAAALEALGQQPPADLARQELATIWHWVCNNWRADRMRGQTEIPARDFGY